MTHSVIGEMYSIECIYHLNLPKMKRKPVIKKIVFYSLNKILNLKYKNISQNLINKQLEEDSHLVSQHEHDYRIHHA